MLLGLLLCIMITNSSSIRNNLIVGLNPAYQKIITIPNLILGSVNRASEPIGITIGGKGQNVLLSSACIIQNKEDMPCILQFCGKGNEGDSVIQLLSNLYNDKNKINELTIRNEGKIRTCMTLISDTETTEIIEPSLPILEDEVLLLLEKLNDKYKDEKVNCICIMGSVPPGLNSDIYSNIIKKVVDKESIVIIDSLFGVNECLQTCNDIGTTTILKLNTRELLKLANIKSVDGNESSMAIEDDKIFQAIEFLKNNNKLNSGKFYVCATDGPFSSIVINMQTNKMYKIDIPNLKDSVINPIGAGDATAAGLLLKLSNKVDESLTDIITGTGEQKLIFTDKCDELIVNSFSFGISVGSASCLSNINAYIENVADIPYIFSKLKIRSI
jgi:fructose-1-phosphate kinase PfkB-like protein